MGGVNAVNYGSMASFVVGGGSLQCKLLTRIVGYLEGLLVACFLGKAKALHNRCATRFGSGSTSPTFTGRSLEWTLLAILRPSSRFPLRWVALREVSVQAALRRLKALVYVVVSRQLSAACASSLLFSSPRFKNRPPHGVGFVFAPKKRVIQKKTELGREAAFSESAEL